MVLNNIRALREAIVYCIPRITIMRDDALGDSGHFLIGDEVFESCCSMLRELKSALDSAPARNCDRPEVKTLEDAIRISADEATSKQELHDMAYNKDLFLSHWLLSPAAQEGGRI